MSRERRRQALAALDEFCDSPWGTTGEAVLLAYLDESYTADAYYIAGMLVPSDEANSLTAALDAVVEKAASSYPGIEYTTELHGHELFHGTKNWKSLAGMVRARIGVYNGAFTAIADHGVKIILRGLDVEAQRRRYVYVEPPHGVVLAHMLERVDETAESHGVPAIVIADEVDSQRSHRRDLWRFKRYTTGGYRARRLTHIVDTIHFVPSEASRLVQAADLVAFLYRRRCTQSESDPRATRANARLWGRIEERIVHQWTWCP